jgi:hypothetical protein
MIFLLFLFNLQTNGKINRLERQLPVNKAGNIAYKILDIEKKYCPDTGNHHLIDIIINTAKSRITLKKKYNNNDKIRIFSIIHSVLSEMSFKIVQKKIDKICFMNNALKSKVLTCYESSIIYLSVCREMGFPVYMVNVPEHVFIRWDEDGKHDLNWETTLGKTETDENYIKNL